jgi:glutamate dehydrogenase
MMATNGADGEEAVEAWAALRQGDVDRVRMSVNEIANSGLTLAKLTVAASLLNDLARD